MRRLDIETRIDNASRDTSAIDSEVVVDKVIYFARPMDYRYIAAVESSNARLDSRRRDVWTIQHSWIPIFDLFVPEVKFARSQ